MMTQLANLAPLAKMANKNKANAFNFINALIKVCQASKVIKKDSKLSDDLSKVGSNKSAFVQRVQIENEPSRDQAMSSEEDIDLSPTKN
mgnify:CR=1 FL=1|jgi:hypothetical protein